MNLRRVGGAPKDFQPAICFHGNSEHFQGATYSSSLNRAYEVSYSMEEASRRSNGFPIHLKDPEYEGDKSIPDVKMRKTRIPERHDILPRKMGPFGLSGLISSKKAAETDPGLVALSVGFDPCTLMGLDDSMISGNQKLLPSFAGPLGNGAVSHTDVEHNVPKEYRLTEQSVRGKDFYQSLRDKFFPLKTTEYKDDILFYMFYTFTSDVLQMLAAVTLYERDWRYHMEMKMWITRIPG